MRRLVVALGIGGPLVAAATAIRGTLSSPWDLEHDAASAEPALQGGAR